MRLIANIIFYTTYFANSNNDIALKNAVKPEGKDYYNAFSIRCIKE